MYEVYSNHGKGLISYLRAAVILKNSQVLVLKIADSPRFFFVSLVDEYNTEPRKDQAGREAIIQEQLGCLDGHAAERTAHALLSMCGNS